MPKFIFKINYIAFSILAILASACQQKSFQLPAKEMKTVSQTLVDSQDEASPDIAEEEQTPVSQIPGNYIAMKVNTIGSDNATQKAGPGILSSTKITAILTDKSGKKSVREANVREQLLSQRSLLLPQVPDGVYGLKVQNSDNKDILLEADNNGFVSGQVTIKGGQVVAQVATLNGTKMSGFGVLFGTQAQCQNPVDNNGDGPPIPVDKLQCTSLESPLVVDLRLDAENSKGIRMSSVRDGVEFDITGKGSLSQTAWIDSSSMSDFGFLALPNSNGQIEGIDNLFGNNTKDPDGEKAENGFLALAKYDENNDSYIDENDSIFAQLRIWTDVVRNGRVDKDELHTLSSLGLTRIKVSYVDIRETDHHGNQTRMRSVAYLQNGDLRAVFDVWFVVAR